MKSKRFSANVLVLAVLGGASWLASACGNDELSPSRSFDSSGDGGAGEDAAAGAGAGGRADEGQGGTPRGAAGQAGEGSTGDTGVPGGAAGQGAGGQGGAQAGAAGQGGQGGQGPFPCLGGELPTSALSTVTVNGTISGYSAGLLNGAEIEALTVAGDTQLDSDTTTGNGSYSLSLETGGAPLDAYLHLSDGGYLDSYVYPTIPFRTHMSAALTLFTAANIIQAATAGDVTLEGQSGFLYAIVFDCEGNRVPGATVTTNPAGDLRYLEGGIPSEQATVTDDDGVALIFNLPVGEVELDAAVGGDSLREHTVEVRADVVTLTGVIP